MTTMPLWLFVKKWQLKVGLAGYYILLAYFVVGAKSKIVINFEKSDLRPYMLPYLEGDYPTERSPIQCNLILENRLLIKHFFRFNIILVFMTWDYLQRFPLKVK